MALKIESVQRVHEHLGNSDSFASRKQQQQSPSSFSQPSQASFSSYTASEPSTRMNNTNTMPPSAATAATSVVKKGILNVREEEFDDRPKNKNSRPVLFASQIVSQVETIPNHESLTPEQHVELWYDTKEVAKIHKDCSETVRKMHNGEPLPDDDPETTSRGLEYMTPHGFDITTSSLEAVHAVLDEQARQKADGEDPDPDLLAEASEAVSRHRSRIAHLAGMKDQRAAAMADRGTNSSSATEGGGGSGSGSVWGAGKVGELPLANASAATRRGRPTRTSSFGTVPRRNAPERRSLRASSSIGGQLDNNPRREGTGGSSKSPMGRRGGETSRHASRSPGRLRQRRQRLRSSDGALTLAAEPLVVPTTPTPTSKPPIHSQKSPITTTVAVTERASIS